MEYGTIMFPAHDALDVRELGRAVEERGFGSLFFPEHTHIPASRATPYAGGELPDYDARTLEPFVARSAVAATTQTLRLGTGVCLVVERDPITTATAVASLDFLSGGRMIFGVGAGWNREEMANHGTRPETRMALLAERVHAMREIWTTDEASSHGRFVDFDRVWSWPKPVQHPGPPVLVGGNGPGVSDRVLDFGDGWMPNRIGDLAELSRRVTELWRRGEAAGRGRLPVTIFGAPREIATLEEYARVGIDCCLFLVPPRGRDVVLRARDAHASLVASSP